MISVIVPAKDESQTVAGCIKALLQQDEMVYGIDYEVIIVDDGSTDDTAAIVSQYPVKLIQQENRGPAAARNAGAKAANGSILAFTDADCFPSRGWLKKLIEQFHDPSVMGIKGSYLTDQVKPVPRFVQLEYEFKYSRMLNQTSIDFIDTYSAAYRKDVFIQNGGFNELLLHLQDQEFSFRLARKGYRLVFEPKSVVYHIHDRTILEYMQRKFGIGYWKAVMLRWIPEKTFRDSHTAPTQRLEIALLAVMLLTFPFFFFWPLYSCVALLLEVITWFLVTMKFLVHVFRNDPGIILMAPGMLIVRAAALGMGLLKGFCIIPKNPFFIIPHHTLHIKIMKRLIDIIGGGLGFLLSLPILGCAAIAIHLDSQGPVIYKQERAGENGKPFLIYKLRTMIRGADQIVKEVLPRNTITGPAYKIPNDPRVTKVGRFLRRWSIDELPQFWNVLRGDMSLVGPRPEELGVVELYNDYQRQRLVVKPGMTGPMQINGGGKLDFDKRLQLELDYLRNYSLLEDLKIMIKTLSVIIWGESVI